jgi:hypothetical protein
MVNCRLTANHAGDGGKGKDSYSAGYGGRAGDGGAVCATYCNQVHCVNCLIADNLAGDGGDGGDGHSPGHGGGAGTGGGFYCDSSNAALRLINCTVINNQTGQPGAGSPTGELGHGGGVHIENANATIANCVLWGNTSTGETGEPAQIYGGVVTMLFSCVEGWTGDLGGIGNMGEDPVFRDPNNADFRLSADSPCIDAAYNFAVWADEFDLDNDGDTTERTPLDGDGLLRFVDRPATPDTGLADPPDYPYVVDMGAYEYQRIGDLDGDCDIGLADLQILLAHYGLMDGAVYADGDLDRDGDVDLADLQALLAVYGTTCP